MERAGISYLLTEFSSRGITIISFRYLTVLRVQITGAPHSLGGCRPWDITKVNASLLFSFLKQEFHSIDQAGLELTKIRLLSAAGPTLPQCKFTFKVFIICTQ